MSSKTAKIIYAGHSTVIIESETGKRIIIDPFLDGNPSCPENLLEPEQIDYICLTHGHHDHSASAVRLAKQHGATVFAIMELANLLEDDGVPEAQLQAMNKGGEVQTPDDSGLSVSLTHAIHSNSYQASDGKVHYAGEAAGIVIRLESGRTIYHAGDTGLFGDMELIGDLYEPHVALLPIGDRYTMGPVDAAKAVELIAPEVVIPIHYETFPDLSGNLNTFVDELEGRAVQTVVLNPGGQFAF